MCNTERAVKINVNATIDAPSNGQVHAEPWPALPDAWTKCDVDDASVVSSWLDVGEEADSNEEDFIVVEDGDDAKKEGKPVLWSAIVGRSAAPAMPDSGKVGKT